MKEGEVLEAGEEELRIVRDIFRTIAKTIKTFSVYPPDNPIYQKFASEVLEKFAAFFESSEELSVVVEQYSLLYKSNEVFHSDEKTDNIAMLLYADGLRQIDFYKGISTEEIMDFIDILRLAPKAETEGEDDIVTLLWEKNIRNMGYTAVEDTLDDDLAIEESLHIDDAESREDVVSHTVENIADTISSSDAPVSALSGRMEADRKQEGETGFLEGELDWLKEGHLIDSAANLIFDLFSGEVSSDAFPEAMQAVGRILEMRMQKSDPEGAITILEGLKKISGLYRSPEQAGMIGDVFLKAASTENLTALLESSCMTIDNTRRYLLLLEQGAVPRMVSVLGDLQDRKKRRLLCEILAVKAKEDIAPLAEAMSDERWYLVRNVAMILGMTREPGAVTHLQRGLKHPDVRVRRETVRALDNIHSEETKRLFLAALSDSDITVRLSSMKALRRLRDPSLFQALKKKSSREELRGKTFAEKRETLETLAILGGEESLPMLADLFRKGWLIEKDEMTELRAAAAYGLGLIGTPEAQSLLEKEADSRKSILREACLQALKSLGKDGIIQR